MNKRYVMSFDSRRCIKCYACEIACLQWHGKSAGSCKPRRVNEKTSGIFPEVKRLFESIACRHCAEAPCIPACPAEAISQRKDGVVLVDREKCTGCQACLSACPDGIPQFDPEGKMVKCDMCVERIDRGLQPICAQNCPTLALRWDSVELSLAK
jgi:anaerobic dimethyl sulfoxide reductase subunit B (iron-sulfur subunit)